MNDEELLSEIDNDDEELFEMYEFKNLDKLMGFEIVQIVLHYVNVKCCKYCGDIFIPSGRSDSKYCDRIKPGETKPCNQIGAFRKRANLVNSKDAHIAYTAAVKRMGKRKKSGSLTEKEYQDWAWQAIEMRDKCLAGDISLPEYITFLDKSRKNEKRK